MLGCMQDVSCMNSVHVDEQCVLLENASDYIPGDGYSA